MLKLVDGSEITEEIKKAFETGIVKQYLKLTDGTIIDSNNYLQSAKLEELRYHEDNKTFIGEAVARRVTVNLYNENNELDLENKEFEFFEGAQGTNKNLYNDSNISFISSPSFTSKDSDNWVTATKKEETADFLNCGYLIKPNNSLKVNSNYYVVTEIEKVEGTGVLYINSNTGQASQFINTVNHSFASLHNGDILIDEVTTRDTFSSTTQCLRNIVQFRTNNFGNIKFRISLFEKEPFIDTFSYVKYNQSLYEYIKHGNFIVQKPENNDTKEKTEFEALDYMCKLNQTYKPRSNFSVYI